MTGFIESTTFYHPMGRPADAVAPFEDVYFSASDGAKIHAWYIPPVRRPGDPARAPAVIHCHGNAGNLEDHAFFSEFFARAGIGVLLFDYRGFGRSDSCRLITRDKLALDTEAALDYLLTRSDVDPTRIGMYGYSLGGAFALAVAAKRPEVRSVCTVSAFSSWQGVASDIMPGLGRLLIAPGMEPVESAAGLGSRPYLAVHGATDHIVKPYHSQKLVEAALAQGTPAELMLVAGAGHADDALIGEGMKSRVAEFFARSLAE